MKTKVQQTSLKAYTEIYEQLGERQQQVYATLKKYGNLNNKEISAFLHVPINCITPRIKELRDKGLVEQKGTKICPKSLKVVNVWGVA